MRIALIASESNPFCKTGGLADVIFSLAKEFKIAGHEPIIILPRYTNIKLNNPELVVSFEVTMSWRHQGTSVFKEVRDGIPFYFIAENYYYDRHFIYGYGDDGERFAFFALAAKQFLQEIDFKPDVIHLNDWQTAIIPFLIHKEGESSYLKNAKTVLTIHNPAFGGLLNELALGELFNLSVTEEEKRSMEMWGQISTLKAGILYSDAITTVSPTHAKELTVDNAYQIGDALVSRGDRFIGVVNGVDTDEFNPEKDKGIASIFDIDDIEKGKKACKTKLFELFGLKQNDGPLFVLVSRIYEQKGIPLVLEVSHRIIERGGSLAVLGNGDESLCKQFEDLAKTYPGKVGFYNGYSASLSHACYAGGDFFLMPSLFEPCGISQMIAQRYACLPIARNTGGLHDTIDDHKDGFLFNDYDYGGIRYGVDEAIDIYYEDKKLFATMRRLAMERDHSWKKSAAQYLSLFQSL